MGSYEIVKRRVRGKMGTVDCIMHRQKNGTGKLALVFPGFAYTCQMPLLYYSAVALRSRGYDVVMAETDYAGRKDFQGLSSRERLELIRDDARAVYSDAVSLMNYDRLMLIGKSIGTIAIASLLQDALEGRRLATVWLTPLLHNAEVIKAIRSSAVRGMLLAIGTKDAEYSKKAIGSIEAGSGRVLLEIADADHSLEVEGDVKASLNAVERVLVALGSIASGMDTN